MRAREVAVENVQRGFESGMEGERGYLRGEVGVGGLEGGCEEGGGGGGGEEVGGYGAEGGGGSGGGGLEG